MRPGPANRNGSCVRDPVAGVYCLISAQGPRVPACPCGLVLDFVLRNQVKSCFARGWSIPGAAWIGIGGWWKAFVCFSMDFGDLVRSLGDVGPPGAVRRGPSVFTVICKGFKGGRSKD